MTFCLHVKSAADEIWCWVKELVADHRCTGHHRLDPGLQLLPDFSSKALVGVRGGSAWDRGMGSVANFMIKLDDFRHAFESGLPSGGTGSCSAACSGLILISAVIGLANRRIERAVEERA
jgi:hypothetical protein